MGEAKQLLLAATFAITMANAQAVTGNALTLWYDKPAEKWVEALPMGNGRLGAMIFGQPAKERLQLNDVTVWSGGPQPDADRKDAYKNLPELRQLIREGKYAEAEKFANDKFNGPAPYNASYQTLGDLNFEFQLPDGAVTNYTRWLDIDSALAGVEFTVGKTKFSREIFSSAPDQVLVERLDEQHEGRVELHDEAVARGVGANPGRWQRHAGDDRQHRHATGSREISITKWTRGFWSKAGRSAEQGDSLKVEGANEAVVLLTCGTSFVLDYAKGYRGADPHVAASRLDLAAKKSYAKLKSAHVADYQKYFHRVSLTWALRTRQSCRPTSV